MLTIVIENPIQFTMVSEVPRDSSGALRATRVENSGESAITTSPQMIKKTSNKIIESDNRNSGETTQHKHDKNNAIEATLFAPKYCERIPLKTQASPPDAMIRNDHSETLRFVSG